MEIRLRIDESANIDDAFHLIEVANFCFNDGDSVQGDEARCLLGVFKRSVSGNFAEVGVIIERRNATGEKEEVAGTDAVDIGACGSRGVGESMSKILDTGLNE